MVAKMLVCIQIWRKEMNKLIFFMFIAIIGICTGCSTVRYEVTSSKEKEGFEINQYKKWVLYDEDSHYVLSGAILSLIIDDLGLKTDYQAPEKLTEDFLIVNLVETYGFTPPLIYLISNNGLLPSIGFIALKSVDITFVDGRSKQLLFKFNCSRGIFRGIYDVYDKEDKKYYATYREFVMSNFYKALVHYGIISGDIHNPAVYP